METEQDEIDSTSKEIESYIENIKLNKEELQQLKFNEENKDNKNTIEKIQQLTLKKPDDMEGNCNNGRGVSDLSDFNYVTAQISASSQR